MLTVSKTEASPGIAIIERPKPELEDDLVLVRVDSVGICGSDVHIYQWTDGYQSMQKHFPLVLGHEFSGVVEKNGPKAKGLFEPGQRITAETAPFCGECVFCRSGESTLCVKRREMGRLGLERDGAMTDYVLVPEETLHAVPDGVSSAEAAVTEPAAVALGAVRRANLSPGDTVLVIGSGTIGLIIVKLCQLMGAGRVLLAGLPSDRERWPVAQIMGADEFIEVNGDNAGQAIREAAGKSGIAVAFDASGAPSVPALAVEAVNPGGEVMLVGIYPKRVTIEVTNNVVRQIKTIKGSYGGHTLDWGRVLRLMASRKLDISPLISMSLPVRRAAEGFEAVIAQKALKVLLKPGRD